MDSSYIKQVLDEVASGSLDTAQAMAQLKNMPFENLGFASIDQHRNLRNGYPETVFCAGKTPEQTALILGSMAKNNTNILATRASKEHFSAVQAIISDAVYYEAPQLIVVRRQPVIKTDKIIAVITAGTSDIPAAEEAAVTAELLGNPVMRIFDVGVAGIHRLFARMEDIQKANVLIVAAGMEGALASVVGGLTDKPVIAVPTSVGYGASFHGLAALLAMLNSCAAGVGVVNIDNGFGAAHLASKINQL